MWISRHDILGRPPKDATHHAMAIHSFRASPFKEFGVPKSAMGAVLFRLLGRFDVGLTSRSAPPAMVKSKLATKSDQSVAATYPYRSSALRKYRLTRRAVGSRVLRRHSPEVLCTGWTGLEGGGGTGDTRTSDRSAWTWHASREPGYRRFNHRSSFYPAV